MVHFQLTVVKCLLCSSQLSPARPAPEVSLSLLCFLLIPRQHSVAVLTSGDALPSCCSGGLGWVVVVRHALGSQGTCLCSSPSSQLSLVTQQPDYLYCNLHTCKLLWAEHSQEEGARTQLRDHAPVDLSPASTATCNSLLPTWR